MTKRKKRGKFVYVVRAQGYDTLKPFKSWKIASNYVYSQLLKGCSDFSIVRAQML